jgi:hypothetical protein
MPTPCRVLATGIDATESNRVNVTGCELQVGQRGRWATRNVRGVDGSLPLTLTAALAGTGELRVSGR